MMQLFRRGCILLLVVLVLAVPGLASNLDWKAYESENFVIFYQEGYAYQAQETAYFLEQALPRVKEITGNDRKLKIRVIIQDVGIDSNGSANPVNHRINIFTNNPTTGDLAGYQNWYRLVGGHELTHMYQLLNYSGAGAIVPTIMGDFYSPNFHVPTWIIEGITVYNESQITPYEGRLNDGYYDAILRAKAQAGEFPSILEADYPHNYFPPGQYYLFGGAFMRYLAETYGEEKITAFFNVHGRNFLSILGAFSPELGVDYAARKVFGKSFAQLFTEWEAVEVARYRDWRIDGELVIDNEYRGWLDNLMVSASGKLYYFKVKLLSSAPARLAGVQVLTSYDPETGVEDELYRLPSGILAKPQIDQNKIYYLCKENKGGFANIEEQGIGATGVLYAYDLQTGKNTRVFSEELKAFLVTNDEIIYTKDQRNAFGTEIWKYTGQEKILLGTIPETVAELAVYKDRLLMVSKERFGGWNINYIDLQTFTIDPVINTAWSEMSITINGDLLYYSANYAHEWGIYTYDFTTKNVAKLTTGGYSFNGVPAGRKLYFKGLTANSEALFTKPLTPVPYQLDPPEEIKVEPVSEFAATLKEKNAFVANLSYLFPDTRFLPFYASGSDGLGTFNYLIQYSPQSGVSVNLSSQLAQPLLVNLESYRTGSGRTTMLSAGYPLYNSSQYGLTNVTIGVLTNCHDWHGGRLQSVFHVPGGWIDASVFTALDTSLITDLSYMQLMDNGSITLKGSVYANYIPGFSFRGMVVSGDTREAGGLLSADLTRKLTEVRRGFWPSTLFVGDVYGGIFADYATHEGGMVSGGVNVKFELGMGYQMIVTPELGVTVNNEGRIRPYFDFALSF